MSLSAKKNPSPDAAPVLAAARAAFEAGADTRMHTEALAAALSMPAAQMQERLRAAGVRPLRRTFTRRGRLARGYALADVDAVQGEGAW